MNSAADVPDIERAEVRRAPITRGGQVSIPAGVRHRWSAASVEIHDHGDHLVLRPAPDDPIASAKGAFPRRAGARRR